MSSSTGSAAGQGFDDPIVFDPGTAPYASFRIPAIVISAGDLLAFCEGRKDSAADHGEIDIVMRRSEDGGRTWGPLQVVASAPGRTVGNPAPVAVPASDAVVLLSVQNAADATEAQILAGAAPDSRRVFLQRSEDGGRSFTAPQEITGSVKAPRWGWYATGPGHGIVLESGRLLVPCNHSLLPEPGGPVTARLYGAHCIYSDDVGRTWSIGFVDRNDANEINGNENAAAQLPDGRLYLNARNQNGTAPGTRADAYSSDGGATLDLPYRPQPTISTPVVQGSVLQSRSRSGPGPLLYAGACDPGVRRRMGIQLSTDGGVTWRLGPTLAGTPAAYADLVQIDPGTVGLLYEAGTASPYDTIRFHRFGSSDLVADVQES